MVRKEAPMIYDVFTYLLRITNLLSTLLASSFYPRFYCSNFLDTMHTTQQSHGIFKQTLPLGTLFPLINSLS